MGWGSSTGRGGGQTFCALSRKFVFLGFEPECTKIERFSADAAAIFTAPCKITRFSRPQDSRFPCDQKFAREQRFALRFKGAKLIPIVEFPAIPESAMKIASEWRCAILVHSGSNSSLNIKITYFGMYLQNRRFFVLELWSCFSGLLLGLLWGRPRKSLFSHFWATFNFSGFRGSWEVNNFTILEVLAWLGSKRDRERGNRALVIVL